MEYSHDQAVVDGVNVSLVRYTLDHDGELVPYRDQVASRFNEWLAQQESTGRRFTNDQVEWLTDIRDHIAASLGIAMDDFDETPFTQKGGAGRAYQLFGSDLAPLLKDLNEVLVA